MIREADYDNDGKVSYEGNPHVFAYNYKGPIGIYDQGDARFLWVYLFSE